MNKVKRMVMIGCIIACAITLPIHISSSNTLGVVTAIAGLICSSGALILDREVEK